MTMALVPLVVAMRPGPANANRLRVFAKLVHVVEDSQRCGCILLVYKLDEPRAVGPVCSFRPEDDHLFYSAVYAEDLPELFLGDILWQVGQVQLPVCVHDNRMAVEPVLLC